MQRSPGPWPGLLTCVVRLLSSPSVLVVFLGKAIGGEDLAVENDVGQALLLGLVCGSSGFAASGRWYADDHQLVIGKEPCLPAHPSQGNSCGAGRALVTSRCQAGAKSLVDYSVTPGPVEIR